jgi:hypothetical protein
LFAAAALSLGTERTPGDAHSDDDLSRAPRVVEDLAGWVEDRTGFPEGDSAYPPDEYKAYCRTLRTARTVSDQAFSNSVNLGITYPHLFEQPEKYRGEVVRYRGRLKRVRTLDAPDLIRSEVPLIHECWIFDLKRYGANPYCAVVTELPAGVRAAEELDVPVTVDGYFFKRWRYKAGDTWRDAPLLIGRTLRLDSGARLAAEKPGEWTFTTEFLVGAFALFGATVGVIIALSWWYRRGDREIRERLAARQRARFELEGDAVEMPSENGFAVDRRDHSDVVS